MNRDKSYFDPLTLLFFVLSIFYSATVLYFFSYKQKIDISKPGEFGGLLSGLCSPLAFLWLLYASLSQRIELGLQRRALEHQQKELAENNRHQLEQFNAMTVQAVALNEQVNIMKVQASDLAMLRERESAELQVWLRWYLLGIQELHHQIIDFTGKLNMDSLLNFDPDPEKIFNLDHIPGFVHVEAGIPKFHRLDAKLRDALLDLAADVYRRRRVEDSIRRKVYMKGKIDEDDVQGFCMFANQIAVKAHNITAYL